MAEYSFDGRLECTRGIREKTDVETIKTMLPGCVSVVKSGVEQDRAGVDFVATLRAGAEVLIDAKTREAGAARWWKGQPELALEIWSVMPDGKYKVPRSNAKAGWTLSERSNVDLILYTFDPKDSNLAYLLSFQLLRSAFVRNLREWERIYKVGKQDSDKDGIRWESQAVFVPASVVLDAIKSASLVELMAQAQVDAELTHIRQPNATQLELFA